MISLHPLGCQRRSSSAAIPADSLLHRERILQPGEGKIVDDHLRHRLEQLELVALFCDPEHDHGLQGRTSRKAAGDLSDGDCRLFREPEALARPLRHPVDGLEAFGAFPDGHEHGFSLSESVPGTRPVRKARAMHEKIRRWHTPIVSCWPASWAGPSCIRARRCCTITGSISTAWPGPTCRSRSGPSNSPRRCADFTPWDSRVST